MMRLVSISGGVSAGKMAVTNVTSLVPPVGAAEAASG